jgi:DNA-binding MarR family transcriptional regulator
MVDQSEPVIPVDNVRSLIEFVGQAFDTRLKDYRKGTRYESVRPSDAKVFVYAQRHPRSLAELARVMGISRQAVQMSIRRLNKLGITALETSAIDHREKVVVVTSRGHLAQQAARAQVDGLEQECSAIIGREGLATLKLLLIQLQMGLAPNLPSRKGQSPD